MRNLINHSKNGTRPTRISTRKSGSNGKGTHEITTLGTSLNLAYQRTRTRPNRSEFLQGDALNFVFNGFSLSELADLLEVPYHTVATWKFNYRHAGVSDSVATKILTKLNFTLKTQAVWKLKLPQ